MFINRSIYTVVAQRMYIKVQYNSYNNWRFSIDLVAHVHFSQKPFHLVIIDYAGRSTSPNDIRIFLE